MTGLGFVCFAVVLVGGTLMLTGLRTLVAMRHAARAELTARFARLERKNHWRLMAESEPYAPNAATLKMADREAAPAVR